MKNIYFKMKCNFHTSKFWQVWYVGEKLTAQKLTFCYFLA